MESGWHSPDWSALSSFIGSGVECRTPICALQEKVNLLEPIITVFVSNGERYNLLNSVVLELFDFIRKENVKILIRYFMEKHYGRVEDVDYDDTFIKLKDKYEQSIDGARDGGAAAASAQLQASRIRKDERALDRGALASCRTAPHKQHVACRTRSIFLAVLL